MQSLCFVRFVEGRKVATYYTAKGAAQFGHVEVARCLGKELGADVNQAAVGGATPLFIAAMKGHVELAV